MEQKQYEKLLSLVVEKLEEQESLLTLQKWEITQLEEKLAEAEKYKK